MERGLKDESSQGRVEYQITPELSVEGRAGAEGGSGVGIRYKKDY
ncbi:MAG: translocation/assembly module TamB domain-containing protein [Candidatus Hydrogenedentes bacterium]|nr:translocation/assembly module TamB domain-containing protein [Candidatus Hydrogenedentota bacterium]